MIEKIGYRDFGNCFKISNPDASVIVSSDFGPRILSYSLNDSENILGWHPDAAVETELGTWRPYGGHRLWIAPENMPLSYAPDNEPIESVEKSELSIRLKGPVDAAGVEKEMLMTLDEAGSAVEVEHRITNHDEAREMSAWTLTIMAPGGEAFIPNEPSALYGPETLLPIRTLTLWPYTDLTDPRWTFHKNGIALRVDASSDAPQKIGVLNKQGWAEYRVGNVTFRKSFDFSEDARYPDMNSNTEIYTAGSFVEVESLSPLTTLGENESLDYRERWQLERE